MGGVNTYDDNLFRLRSRRLWLHFCAEGELRQKLGSRGVNEEAKKYEQTKNCGKMVDFGKHGRSSYESSLCVRDN
jgi:hypothetical protein